MGDLTAGSREQQATAKRKGAEAEAGQQRAGAKAAGASGLGSSGQDLGRALGSPERAAYDSDRFGNDGEMQALLDNTKALRKGASGPEVRKVQQALVDLGHLPPTGVTGTYDDATVAAVEAFQKASHAKVDGVVGPETMGKMDGSFESRQPYLDQASYDAGKPGTRDLDATEKDAVQKALVPPSGAAPGTSGVFTEEVDGKKYGARITDALRVELADLHKRFYSDKEALRKDPSKIFDWSDLEGAVAASKDQVDGVYGSYASGDAMTAAKGTLVDMWEDQEKKTPTMSDADKYTQAENLLKYLVNSDEGIAKINTDHGAEPDRAAEAAILAAAYKEILKDKAVVDRCIQIDQGWPGAQSQGSVYFQRFKEASEDENRVVLWKIFQVGIHEYLHLITNNDYYAYADALGGQKRHTLIEGFTEFFTLNVRKSVKVSDPLRQKVEGSVYDKKKPAPSVNVGVYSAVTQAEQVVAIVGVKNAQAAYFQGKVQYIGGP